MRKLVIGAALASTALASPALARDNQWYVELDGGAMIVEDLDFDIGTASDEASADMDKGFDFGGIVGYDFGSFRLEAEASYRQADADSVSVGTSGLQSGATGLAQSGTFAANGDASALSFMVNGLLDFGPDDGLQGFVGGGAGVARTDINLTVNSAGPDALDDSDTGFAWQVLAGVRAPLTDNWDVGLKYRFFNADDVQLVDSLGRDVETRFRSHSILGTLTYNFGGAEAPPPPPPPPPVCNKGPYIVFFDWDQSDITPEAATILDNAVSAYANCDNVPIMLAGYTDRSGTVEYNLGLAARRNASVTEYLTGRGIPGGAITSEAFGEANPRVPTADGVRELQNRRVEITYGPGSGM
jgi:opacity protein-like surface antigen